MPAVIKAQLVASLEAQLLLETDPAIQAQIQEVIDNLS